MFLWEWGKTEGRFATLPYLSRSHGVGRRLNEGKTSVRRWEVGVFPSIIMCDSEIYEHLSASLWQQFGSCEIGYSAERLQRVKQRREAEREQWQDHNGMLGAANISSHLPSAGWLREKSQGWKNKDKKSKVLRKNKIYCSCEWTKFVFFTFGFKFAGWDSKIFFEPCSIKDYKQLVQDGERGSKVSNTLDKYTFQPPGS